MSDEDSWRSVVRDTGRIENLWSGGRTRVLLGRGLLGAGELEPSGSKSVSQGLRPRKERRLSDEPQGAGVRDLGCPA